MRFIEKEDCYLDNETDLEWSLENYGQMTWEQAQKKMTDGWRVPTRKELFAITDDELFDPCTELPGMVSSDYWSATPFAGVDDYAWRVDFDDGYVNDGNKMNEYYVRAVRGKLK